MPVSLYGWQVSPYTAKVRAYLDFKEIPYTEIIPSAFTLNGKIKNDVGQIIMPVLYQDGQAIQDSSVIIDKLEAQQPTPRTYSTHPTLRIAELILEMFADEWLPMAALHYRWNYPENRPFILKEFGKSALPWWPGFIQNFVAKQFGKKMSGYLPILGINSNTEKALESNTHRVLSTMDSILSEQSFLMGNTPTLADFSMYGPIYAHLYRDPYPDDLVKPYKHVVTWIHSLQGQPQPNKVPPYNETQIIERIQPLLIIWRDSHWQVLKQTISSVNEWLLKRPSEQRKLPKVLGKSTIKIEGKEASRLNLTYGYWMWQRIHSAYSALNEKDKATVKQDLDYLGINDFLDETSTCIVKLDRCRLYTINDQ